MSSVATEPTYERLLGFLHRLNEQRVPYTLTTVRQQAIMVQFAVPGERWEVEFLADGAVEVERFRSDGRREGKSALDELWEILAEGED